jgi:HEAT repeat protein
LTGIEEVADMNTPHQERDLVSLLQALKASSSSTRLRAALAAGTDPDPQLVEPLVERCAIEPDFFVRDMLTWALLRHPGEVVIPSVLTELHSETAQARSQALHTLSKIGDRSLWLKVPKSLLHDTDDEVARTAWRAAVVLVSEGRENELAAELAIELGRGDRDLQRSLSRAMISLDEAILPFLDAAMAGPNPSVRAHAKATERLRLDPESEFTITADDAQRIVNAGNALPDGS